MLNEHGLSANTPNHYSKLTPSNCINTNIRNNYSYLDKNIKPCYKIIAKIKGRNFHLNSLVTKEHNLVFEELRL